MNICGKKLKLMYIYLRTRTVHNYNDFEEGEANSTVHIYTYILFFVANEQINIFYFFFSLIYAPIILNCFALL